MVSLYTIIIDETRNRGLRLPDICNATRTVAFCYFVAAFLIGSATTLMAYDCSQNEKAHIVTLDLTGPADCPDPEKDYLPQHPQQVQILQTDASVPVTAFRCQITVTRAVTRCGYDSLTYGTSYPEWEQQYEVTPAECRKAATDGSLEVDGQEHEVQVGEVQNIVYHSHGSHTADGSCETANFVSKGIAYEKSYELVQLRVAIEVIRGTIDLASGQVTFVNGIRANYKDQVLRDAYEGTLVWEAVDPPCNATVSEVYFGASHMYEKKGARSGDRSGSIIMVSGEKTQQYAGLVLKQPRSVCGVHCHSTQVEGIVACLLRDWDTPIPRQSFKEYFDASLADIQTQISYLHVSNSLRFYNRIEELTADLCQVDRKRLYNKLQALSGASNQYALLDLYGPGHTVTVAGAVAYVTQCTPVEVTLAPYPNCTMEVPVLLNGSTRFADPYTWVLHEYGTEVVCNDIMPISWKINGVWMCASPTVHQCMSPVRLNATYRHDGSFTQLELIKGIGHGIFTQDQLERNRQFRVSQMSRSAVVQRITNAATGGRSVSTTDETRGLGSVIPAEDLENIVDHIGAAFLPFWGFFGRSWIYVSGVFLFLAILKALLGVLMRTCVLYRRRGLGPWILWAVWETAFLVIYTPWRVVKATVKEATGANLPPGRSGVVGGQIQLVDLERDRHSDDEEEDDIVVHPGPSHAGPAAAGKIDELKAQIRDLTRRTDELYGLRNRNGSVHFVDEKTARAVDDFDPDGPSVFNLDPSTADPATAPSPGGHSDPPSYNGATHGNPAVLNITNGASSLGNAQPSDHFTHSHY